MEAMRISSGVSSRKDRLAGNLAIQFMEVRALFGDAVADAMLAALPEDFRNASIFEELRQVSKSW